MMRLLLTFLIVPASLANAQDDPRIDLQRYALAGIHEAYCSETQKCAPATDAEIASPPLSLDLMTNIGQAAAFSAGVDNCGGDFETRIYVPFMRTLRGLDVLSERELALASLLHGIQMQGFKKRPDMACSSELRGNLEAQGLL